ALAGRAGGRRAPSQRVWRRRWRGLPAARSLGGRRSLGGAEGPRPGESLQRRLGAVGRPAPARRSRRRRSSGIGAIKEGTAPSGRRTSGRVGRRRRRRARHAESASPTLSPTTAGRTRGSPGALFEVATRFDYAVLLSSDGSAMACGQTGHGQCDLPVLGVDLCYVLHPLPAMLLQAVLDV
ncbi:unnamed protein product, partial [Prorocentrum cordatum]